MPVYTYRREDGTTFDLRQSFNDDALTIDPSTGQKVVRVIQGTSIIFKGSGFYVNDSKGANKATMSNVNKDKDKDAAPKTDATPATSTASSDTASPAPAPAKTPATSSSSTAAD